MLLFHLPSLMNGEEKNIKRMQNTGKNMDSIFTSKDRRNRIVKGSWKEVSSGETGHGSHSNMGPGKLPLIWVTTVLPCGAGISSWESPKRCQDNADGPDEQGSLTPLSTALHLLHGCNELNTVVLLKIRPSPSPRHLQMWTHLEKYLWKYN